MNDENRFIIDNMIWSFSRLNYNCLFEWDRHYIQCEWQEGNFYAEFGSLIHKCLEIYAGGILPEDQILEYYDNNFDEYCQTWFDPEKKEQYYLQGYDYLQHIPLDLEKYEVLGVEKKLEFTIKEDREGYEEREYPMIGFIDLLLKNKETGEITILDHKSSQMKFKKNGDPYKADEEHWKAFQRQLYLYSLPLIDEGQKISYLTWNMFRAGIMKTIEWKAEDCEEARIWALDTIHKLESEEDWLPNQDFFYCHNLCGYRNCCSVSKGEDDGGYLQYG